MSTLYKNKYPTFVIHKTGMFRSFGIAFEWKRLTSVTSAFKRNVNILAR